jgi:hypothetical protein
MRRLLIALLCCFSTLLLAQQEMEIIPLQHRTVDQVLPTLLPFVEPGGALSGMNNQLILRGSAKNRAQIKQALVAMDTPPRRLIIRVSQNRGGEGQQQAAEASLSVVGTQRGDASLNARTVDTRSLRDARTAQSLQVVDGARAFIQIGQSLPLPLRQTVLGPKGVTMSDSVVYRDMGQGFYAVPRLAGDRVTLEISPQSETPNAAGGSTLAINTQRLSTTVSGRLGEWIELGGSSQQESGSAHGQWSAGTNELRDRRSVWLQVEELP